MTAPTLLLRQERHFDDRLVRCFAERPASVPAMFDAAVRARPDALALIDGDRRLNYRDLAGEVTRLAAGMAAHGVGPGDRVALLVGNRAEFFTTLLATIHLGAIAVPLSIREQAPGLAYMLHQSGARMVVAEATLVERLPAPSGRLPGLELVVVGDGVDGAPGYRDLLAESPGPVPAHQPEEDDTAVLLYTSGTTGRPKAARLTHVGIAHSVRHYALTMGLGADSRSLLAVPASHVTGVVAILLTMLHVGGATVMLPAFKARRFLELAAAERTTHTVLVPAMYHLCLMDPAFSALDLSAWRVGAYGGAPMPEATIKRLADALPGLQLVNAYGATETTSPATLMPLDPSLRHADSVGRPVHCAEILIMGADGREAPTGTPGEIWIKGPMVVPGYFANDTATRAGFTAGYWRSGDVGSIDADGYVRVLDRLKDVINRGGYTIYSAEIENTLSHHPAIAEVAVVARPDPVLGEKIHAFVGAPTGGLTTAAVQSFCRERLAEYKVPDFVTIETEPLPRNANGKLLKARLKEREFGA